MSVLTYFCLGWSVMVFAYCLSEKDIDRSQRGLIIAVLFLIAAGVWR